MRRSRKIQLVFLITLVSIIGVMSIAYAVLSTTLNITGSSEVVAASWNVYFSNVEMVEQIGSAAYTTPSITNTKISNYNISLTKPGDSVTFAISLKNESDMVAEISSIINSTPICTSSTGNSADEELVCDNLVYEYKLADGTELQVGDILAQAPNNFFCRVLTELAPVDNTIFLTIGFSDTATSVPSSNVTISNLTNEIIFTQSESECSTSGGGGGGGGTTNNYSIVLSATPATNSISSIVEIYGSPSYPITINYKLLDATSTIIKNEIYQLNDEQEHSMLFEGLNIDCQYTIEVQTIDSNGLTRIKTKSVRTA